LAEAFDGAENFVGGLGPFVGLGVFVVTRDECADIGFPIGGFRCERRVAVAFAQARQTSVRPD
jgi:hypothetical protein